MHLFSFTRFLWQRYLGPRSTQSIDLSACGVAGVHLDCANIQKHSPLLRTTATSKNPPKNIRFYQHVKSKSHGRPWIAPPVKWIPKVVCHRQQPWTEPDHRNPSEHNKRVAQSRRTTLSLPSPPCLAASKCIFSSRGHSK